MWPNPQKIAELVTFTEDILNGKLYFLCIDGLNLFIDYYLAYWEKQHLLFLSFWWFVHLWAEPKREFPLITGNCFYNN